MKKQVHAKKTQRAISFYTKDDVTRDDSQFLAQRSVEMLEQCCNYSKQCRNDVATLCCAKNRRCELLV